MTDHYSVLGVAANATVEQIKSAFKYLATQWHPDVNSGATEAVRQFAEERFKAINTAHSILSDPAKRQAYDMRLRAERSSERAQAQSGPQAQGPQPQPRKKADRTGRRVRTSVAARRALKVLESELSSTSTTQAQQREAATTILKFEAVTEARRSKLNRINDLTAALKEFKSQNLKKQDEITKLQVALRKANSVIRARGGANGK